MTLFTFATHVLETSTALRYCGSVNLADLCRANYAWTKGLGLILLAGIEANRHMFLRVFDLLVHLVTCLNK